LNGILQFAKQFYNMSVC